MMAKAILLPAIITSMLKFSVLRNRLSSTFPFVSPLLWVIRATLTAASQAVCDIFTVRPWRIRAYRIPDLQPAAAGLINALAWVYFIGIGRLPFITLFSAPRW